MQNQPFEIRLDLGAGEVVPEGFTPMGNGHLHKAIFPLPHQDGSVTVIRASHVLEHFSHGQVEEVIKDWVRALKSGGELRIAVPDFAKVAQGYLDGAPQNTLGYVMGGQIDEADYHKTIFDEAHLKRLMAQAGLVMIRPWTSEIEDCAALPISLNLCGVKPFFKELSVSCVMSMPRVTWTANSMCWVEALMPHRIAPRCYTGAYWDQCLERAIEEAIREEDPDLILTVDFDTVFARRDVATLIQLMMIHPEVDALAPIQAARGRSTALFTVDGTMGDVVLVPAAEFASDVKKVSSAHFGMTMLRADKIGKLSKPWFQHKPAPDGSWGEGRRDADISFWDRWAEAGNSLHIANRVPVGHLEVMIRWPGSDLNAIHQDYTEWRREGAPPDVWR